MLPDKIVVYMFTKSDGIVGYAFRFSAPNFGKLFGLVMTVSAAFSLVQYPLFLVQENTLDGDPFAVYCLYKLITCLVSRSSNCLTHRTVLMHNFVILVWEHDWKRCWYFILFIHTHVLCLIAVQGHDADTYAGCLYAPALYLRLVQTGTHTTLSSITTKRNSSGSWLSSINRPEISLQVQVLLAY